MTVRSRPSWLRGLLAPLLAVGALPVGALFVCTCREQDATPVLAWEGATLLALLVALRTQRFRDRPAAAAGLFGVVGWVLVLGVLGALSTDVPDPVVLGWLALGPILSMIGATIAERPEAMRETALPGGLGRGLTVLLALGSIMGATHLATRTREVAAEIARPVGTVEIPALATVVRERLPPVNGADALEVEVSSSPLPGGSEAGGGVVASLHLLRDVTSAGLAARTLEACTFEVPPLGRTVEIFTTDTAYEIRWPVSPHGESFGGCRYDRVTLAPSEDVAVAHGGGGHAWPLALAPLFGLLVLGLAWPLRRAHARIARSPELRVSAPGVAVMPDGSPAVVPADIPMGATIVALRISDLAADYRSDARIAVDEHAVGEKPSLLVDLARRVRTLELLALGGTLLLSSTTLVSALVGGFVTF
jgi:hypothetical protein